MRKILATAIREFKATALTKGFIFGTFILPVLIWAVLGAAFAFGLFDPDRDAIKGTIAVVDTTPDEFFVHGLESFFDQERQEAIRRLKIETNKEMLEKATENLPVGGAGVGAIDLEKFERQAPEVTIDLSAPSMSLARV